MPQLMNLEQLVNFAEKHANSVLVGSAKAQIIPTFHIQFKDRAPALISTPWSDGREKRIAIEAIREALKRFRSSVLNYCFMSEAWVATEDVDHPIGLMPSEREDKREVVMISANAPDTKGLFVILEIKRDAKGRVTELKRHEPIEVGGGHLENLFEEER